jgi:hypothetical protein
MDIIETSNSYNNTKRKHIYFKKLYTFTYAVKSKFFLWNKVSKTYPLSIHKIIFIEKSYENDIMFLVSFYNNTCDNSEYIEKTLNKVISTLQKHIGHDDFCIICLVHTIGKRYKMCMKKENDSLINIDLCCKKHTGTHFCDKTEDKFFDNDLRHIISFLPDSYNHEHINLLCSYI